MEDMGWKVPPPGWWGECPREGRRVDGARGGGNAEAAVGGGDTSCVQAQGQDRHKNQLLSLQPPVRWGTGPHSHGRELGCLGSAL